MSELASRSVDTTPAQRRPSPERDGAVNEPASELPATAQRRAQTERRRGRASSRSKDGNELTGLAKLAYKPFGLVFGMLGGVLAGRVFGLIWRRISHEDDTPQPLSDDYTTREVLIAATLQGAVFGLIKTAVDRYGLKGVRRVLDKPRPPARRRVANVT